MPPRSRKPLASADNIPSTTSRRSTVRSKKRPSASPMPSDHEELSDVKPAVKKSRTSRRTAKSRVEDSEEEPVVGPASRKSTKRASPSTNRKSNKRSKKEPTPEPEPEPESESESEAEAEEEEEEEEEKKNYEQEEEDNGDGGERKDEKETNQNNELKPSTPSKLEVEGEEIENIKHLPEQKLEDEDSEDQNEETKPLQPVQSKPELDNTNETLEPVKQEPQVIDPLVPPAPKVNTAYDLSAQAKNAALNHAAMEKQLEKEREGKPRLVIHQLVLENFKSYRGRGVIGPFHKSFSAVVGPNGSGKSNTIDALLFVFGYRASKMRQGKLSELIHNSGPASSDHAETGNTTEQVLDNSSESEVEKSRSKKGKGKKKKAPTRVVNTSHLIQSCTVEVWFREIIDLEDNQFSVVPDSQLRVSRTAFRDNSSTYSINGRSATFKEVTSLLKGRGIDLDHNRFLILQGEVESIAQMKPKGANQHDEGLLEYLEDIIGTAKYKPLIEEAMQEVEQFNDARTNQVNRVKLVEREKSALESRKKEADVYLRDQNELAHNQSALWQVYAHQAHSNMAVLQEQLAVASKKLEDEVGSQEGIRKEVEDIQAEYDALLSETKTVEKECNNISKQLHILERSDVQFQEKKKATASKIKKLNKTMSDDTHARSEAETYVKNYTEELESVGKDIADMEAFLEKEEAALDTIRDSLKDKTQGFSNQIEVLQRELQPWTVKAAEKQGEIDIAKNQLEMLKEKFESVKTGIEEAEEALNEINQDGGQKQTQLSGLEAEKVATEKQIGQLEKRLQSMTVEDNKLRGNVNITRQKTEEAKASQAASRSQGNVLNSLNKLKDQGRLAGFHGRLGNLGRIDDKYDIAISTACPGLDNLVADTVTIGQSIIDHLRKHDLGRANIMCLDSIKKRDLSKISTPENAPRLFDLITIKDPRFAPAFYQLLTNTLVANDLDQGKRLAFGSGGTRWRVVTLDGQVIDVSGTMSGGGGRPQKGRMSSKITEDAISPEMVAKCEKEHSSAIQALKVFAEDQQKLQMELKEARQRLPEIEMNLEKIHLDLKTGKKRKAEVQARIKDLRSHSTPKAGDTVELKALETRVAGLTKEHAKLKNDSSGIEIQIKLLHEKILEAGGVRLRSQQTKVSDLKARIDHANDRLTKAEVGRNKCEKDVEKLSKTISQAGKGLCVAEEELQELESQIKAGEYESDQVRKAVEKAQDILGQKQEELSEMKVVLDEKVEHIQQFRKRELVLKQEVAAHQKELDEASKAVEHWTAKIGELELNQVIDSDSDSDDEKPEEQKKTEKLASALQVYDSEEIQELDVKLLKGKISALEERLANSNLDLAVIKEYAKREEEFLRRVADLDAVTKERDTAKKKAEDLRSSRLKEFMEGFGIISMKLKEMYQLITLGGNAELELVDSLDPFSEGIIFSVMPPKKSWKNISNLSGGEKTLSSLALVFALHVYKPTPLYFMDEIDAALDFKNVSIVANYIKDRTKNAQFVVISLRNNMFELASRLLGIYKVANQTRSVAIDNSDLNLIGNNATQSHLVDDYGNVEE